MHLVGFSMQSWECEEKILEQVHVDCVKNKGNMHYEYSLYGLTAAPALGRDARWSGPLAVWDIAKEEQGIYTWAGGEGGGRIDCGSPLLVFSQCLATCGRRDHSI